MTEGLSESDRQEVDRLVKELSELLERAVKLIEKAGGEKID